MDKLWEEICDQCLEPLAICNCGYSWNLDEDDDEPLEDPCHDWEVIWEDEESDGVRCCVCTICGEEQVFEKGKTDEHES